MRSRNGNSNSGPRSRASGGYSDNSDRYEYEAGRSSYRDRDSYDYDLEERSRPSRDYYFYEDDPYYYSRPGRNMQMNADIYEDRPRRNLDEDYNDRDYVGSRNTGHSNYRGGGGDLYQDLGDRDFYRGYREPRDSRDRNYTDRDRGFQDRDQMSGRGSDYDRPPLRRRR